MPRQNILPMIADRFLNTPLLIDPSKAATIYGVLQGRIAADIPLELTGSAGASLEVEADNDRPTPEATRFAGNYRTDEGGFSYLRRAKGVALIDITGSLVNRGAWIGASSGMTSYEGISAQIDRAREGAESGEIIAAILDINSPGGEATGMFGAAEKVRALAAIIPVIAVVNDVAASAAYGIASGATEIVISPTSFVGSIGVVMVHIDHSGEMEQKGHKATILQAGAKKTEGHPFGPLSASVKASLQSKVNTLYDRFLETVEAGRGERLNAAAARETEADIFIGQEAIDLGIADRIGTFDAVLEQLQSNALSGSNTETIKMATTPNGPKSEGGATYTQAQQDSAVATAKAEGIKEGAASATTRIGAILTSEAGKANVTLAAHLAFKTEMDADAAISTLTAAGISGSVPVAPTTPPGPEQRAGTEPEMGADDPQPKPSASSGWGDVTASINKRIA